MFYDTSSLLFQNSKGWHVDCQTAAGRAWIYETVRLFFSQTPPDQWACVDGRPMVFVYHPAFAERTDRRVYAELRRRFAEDFGVAPFIVTAAEEDGVMVTAPDVTAGWADDLLTVGVTAVLAGFPQHAGDLQRLRGG